MLSSEHNVTVTDVSSPSEKITLFRSLFRGRTDVYARRFESRKTGRSGYSPACANEWTRGLCDKRRVKCGNCPNRRLLPVTEAVIRQHLSGVDSDGRDFVIGLYPMLLDETCLLLAADFDKATWREDIASVQETCRYLELPVAMERSRSGHGAHLWVFFEEAVPAVLARKLGAHILTATMERRPGMGLDSYDRLFPNQDTLPEKLFGNLIALPLQKGARQHGNSVFVDEEQTPFPDQWAFLSSIRKVPRTVIERIVRMAEGRGQVIGVRLVADDEDDHKPWQAPPSRRRKEIPIAGSLPETLELVLGNEIYVPKAGLAPELHNRLIRLAAFQNPEFYRAQAMRFPTFDKPRIIACAEDHPKHIGLPRGCLEDVLTLLNDLGISPAVRDERQDGSPLGATFLGELRPEQRTAARALATHDNGVLAATTAFGKTVVAAWLIAKRGANTLVLVHRQQLMEQWVARLSSFLDIEAKDIGRIGGGKRKPNGMLDVALIQSLVRKGEVADLVGEYGHLVVDECHRLPAPSFERVARRARPRYVLGLSATVTRKDGHHPIVFMHCGPIRHRVKARRQAAERPFNHNVLVRPTAFRQPDSADADGRVRFHEIYASLAADESRNRLIVEDVIAALNEGRSPIVLTERTEHLQNLADRLSSQVKHLFVLRGGMGRKKTSDAFARLATVPPDEERLLLATGRYIGEGFDDPRLDTLFLALPVSWKGTIAQYAGRLHRLHDQKREVRIYDYADLNVPVLGRMFDRRCRGYEAIGYTIFLPASAVPGWPPDVPLPVEPEWKRDYAASVQRLIRDGVDTSLGNLFVHAARAFRQDAQGVDRARSATEAFLYRRLQTLPETVDRFQLNADLPISFDGHGRMEVDLLCESARLAVELDGPQHLTDLSAYRRDRRKDALLQENGYFVLRFLAEDVGKRLDHVLDTILRALEHLTQREQEVL